MNKSNLGIFLVILFMVIGFAAVNTVLEINGNVSLAYDEDDFKINISNVLVNGEARVDLISEDKQSFTYVKEETTDTLEDVTITYVIENASYKYDADIQLTCNPSEAVSINQVNIVEAQSRKRETITTNLDGVTCSINIKNIIGRSALAEAMCSYDIGENWDFSLINNSQEFKALCGGNYKIELWGAQGSYGYYSEPKEYDYEGGRGAYTSGEITLTQNQTLQVYVGGSGENGSYNGGSGKSGGLMGGKRVYGSGGGATDVRIISGEWDNFDSLKTRIMVAAGGGGAFDRKEGYGGGNGGAGGALVGFDGESYNHTNNFGYGIGHGGTQIDGGLFEWTDLGNSGLPSQSLDILPSQYNCNLGNIKTKGAFGYGGEAACREAGGGSGYYGGGGTSHGGAGGGSSFISGYTSCDAIDQDSTADNIIHTGQPNHYLGIVFKNSEMISGNGEMPTHDGKSTMVGNTGDGYAKITYLGE